MSSRLAPYWSCRILLVTLLLLPHASVAADPAATDPALSVPPAGQILQTLRSEHPRLHLTPDRLASVKRWIAEDPLAAKIYASIEKRADRSLGQPPSTYEKPDGKRLLSVSRRVLDRVTDWGFLYRMTGNRRYVDRAWTELEAAAAFPDWNPDHFLDTAEMTRAFATGYDWLYDVWTDRQRAALREAIVEKGLRPALLRYEPKPRSWATVTNNWNQVCNGGIGLGALAVAEAEPQMAGRIVAAAVRQIPLAIRVYRPDGAGTEGVTYWHYATIYNTALLDGLQTALGTQFGLDQVDGYAQSGDFQLYFSGANRDSFDFGDCGQTRLSSPQHFWFGTHYRTPRYSWFRYAALQDQPERSDAFDLLWYDASAKDLDPRAFALDKHFRGAELAVMGSAWGDPNALVLGIEGAPADNYNHRHLDSGSFIFEADGVRWIVDCGTEHETYMTHRNHVNRWDFYRTRAEGHNALVLTPGPGPDQVPKTPAPITRFESQPDRCVAEVDLSQPYAPHADRVTRMYSMLDRKRVVIRDEVHGARAADLWWFLHTQAKVELAADGRAATLSRKDRHLKVVLRDPPAARFEVMDAKPLPSSPNPAQQADNRKIRKLAIHIENVRDLAIEVELIPGGHTAEKH